MDSIARAIACGWHLSGNEELREQCWEDFEKASIGKHVFLFGMGVGAEFFLIEYPNILLKGVIDNSKEKQGKSLRDLRLLKLKQQQDSLYISNISVLKHYATEEVVVLITSLQHYEQICDQLEAYGITQKFVMLIMEANRRAGHAVIAEEELEEYICECCRYAIDKKKIIFRDQGSYCGHGKYITEQLLKIRADLDIVWLVGNLSLKVPLGIRLVDNNDKKKVIYEMETAGMWVFDYWIPIYIEKRPEQIYVQVKHWASITLKTFGLDYAIYRKDRASIYSNIYNGKIMDYIITGSEFDEISSRRGFNFKGKVFEAGSCRSDVLFKGVETARRVKEFYHIEERGHILLYVPTFRVGKEGFEASNIILNYKRVKQVLEERFGGRWYILLRLHPSVADESSKLKMSEYVIDASHYDDGQELVAASDVMITDYSSIMFEPAFVKKPVFLLAPDRKKYIDGERELLIDYDTLPFPIAETNDKLVRDIENFNQEIYEKNVGCFLDKYGVHEDGKASERAAAFISGLIDSNE